jgi:hypothetical protein
LAKKIPYILLEIKNFKPIKIDYRFQKNVSYSQFLMYKQCPKKWSLQYRDGHKIDEQSIHFVFGTSLHETVQHYLDVMYEKSIAEADKIDLEEHFKTGLMREYQSAYVKNQNIHFSSAIELREFYEDGIAILDTFKKKKSKYFSKRGWHLVGCEVPITLTPNKRYPNVIYQGHLDVVLYNENTQSFKIIDIKTSTRGWNDKTKKDEGKQFQLVLYKKFFSEQFNIPLDKINVEFFIVKRKIWEESDFPISRIQTYSPPSGKVKINKVDKELNEFIESAFTKEGYSQKDHLPKLNDYCEFCSFYKTHLCSATSKY